MAELNGTDYDDTLTGGAGPDYLYGGAGRDLLSGGDGNDVLYGEAGDDRLDGGAGNDILEGNDGDDDLAGGAGDDLLIDNAGSNALYGGDGDDTLHSHGSSATLLDGGSGNDVLEGGNGASTFDGGAGNDILRLSAGWGEALPARQVLLDGGEGEDRIELALGRQARLDVRVTTGAGRDTVALADPGQASQLTIADFATGADADMLSIQGLIASSDYLAYSVNPFASGHVQLVQEGPDTLVRFDIDGSAGPLPQQTVARLSGVTAAALTIGHIAELFDPLGGVTGITLNGDERDNILTGGMMIDTLYGGDGNDYLAGGGGDDLVDGGAGNDVLVMEAGIDTLSGGAGTDTVVFWAERSFFLVTEAPGGLRVADLLGQGSIALLSGIERLLFTDAARAYDIDGIGGQVYRLYQAAFDRVPDRAGLGFWIAHADAGMPLGEITAAFVSSDEFGALYGASPSHAEIVQRFYQNVLHRPPDAVGQAFWIDILERQLGSVADVLASFSDSPENKAALAPLIGQGFEYLPYA